MDVESSFASALRAESVKTSADADLPAVRLVRAAAAVLGVDGVGLSLHVEPDLRVPLAASDEVAETVERLQFTAGRGPCMQAAETRLPVFATQGLIAVRWPAFHDLLVTRTPLRSVLALCLPGRLRGLAGLDLYSSDPVAPLAMDLDAARTVAGQVAAELDRSADWSAWASTGTPAWADTPTARRRGRLWTVVGMLALALRLPTVDALALLRAHAYATERTADDLADDLVERRLSPDELRPDQDPVR